MTPIHRGRHVVSRPRLFRPLFSPAVGIGDLRDRTARQRTVFAEWVADRHQGKSEHIAGQAQNRPDFILMQNVVRRDQGSEAERPARQNDVLYGWIDARASNLRLIGQMGLVALRYSLWQRITWRHIARS